MITMTAVPSVGAVAPGDIVAGAVTGMPIRAARAVVMGVAFSAEAIVGVGIQAQFGMGVLVVLAVHPAMRHGAHRRLLRSPVPPQRYLSRRTSRPLCGNSPPQRSSFLP